MPDKSTIRSANVVIRDDRVRVALDARAQSRPQVDALPVHGELALPPHFARKIKSLLAFVGDPSLAAAVGLDVATLDGGHATIPLSVYHALLERAAAVTADAHVGLRFALHWHDVQRHDRGTVGVLMRSSPTLRTLCDRLVNFQRYWNAGDRYDVAERGTEFQLRYRVSGPWREAHRHMAEMTVASFVAFMRELVPPAQPVAVRFPFGPSGDPADVARLLGVTPTYGAPSTEIVLPRAAIDVPLATADASLFRLSERYLRMRLDEVPASEPTFGERVRHAVEGAMHEEGFGEVMIARRMYCGQRTMQRRLQADGTTLRAMVDDVRKSRARELLASRLSVAETAFLLGYAEPAAFQHAFRRWFGMSPKVWRDAARASAVDVSTSSSLTP